MTRRRAAGPVRRSPRGGAEPPALSPRPAPVRRGPRSDGPGAPRVPPPPHAPPPAGRHGPAQGDELGTRREARAAAGCWPRAPRWRGEPARRGRRGALKLTECREAAALRTTVAGPERAAVRRDSAQPAEGGLRRQARRGPPRRGPPAGWGERGAPPFLPRRSPPFPPPPRITAAK